MNEVKSSRPTDLGIADEPTEHPPFLGSRELSASNTELNRKRKLQYEEDNLGLPWPKQKCPDHFSSTAREFLNFNSTTNDGTHGKEIASAEIHDKLGQSEESDNNSNNSSRVDDNCMMLDVQAKEEKSIFLHNSQSPSPDASGHATSNEANEGGTPDSEVILQSEPRENATGNGLAADYIDDPELAQYDMECCDGAQDDIILYSNDAAPFLFSSERRRLGQDSRTRSPKPTIDEEFEQYFSVFMH